MTSLLKIETEKAIAAAKRQAEIAKQLQAEGLRTIKSIRFESNPESAARLLQQAINAIDKGCKIEDTALTKILKYSKFLNL